MPPLKIVSMRIAPPIRMQVSVPGMYKKPAPYREQTFTYSTALALTGRSAACAPLTAIRAAAEPKTRLLTIFMLTSKLLYWERPGPTVVQLHFRKNESLAPNSL